MVYTRARENKKMLTHTHAYEKNSGRLYARKINIKKIRSHTNVRKIDLRFNLLKYMLEKNRKLEWSNLYGKNCKSWKLCNVYKRNVVCLCILYNAIMSVLVALYGANYAGYIGT